VQGLVNVTGEIGYFIAVLIPTFCYLTALACFLFAAWGFWMQSRPDNPHRGAPWVPGISLLLSGVFASFDKILTMANASAGTGLTVSVGALTGYTPPSAAGFTQGATPGDTVVNVTTLFQGFLQPFGALACFFAIVAWRAVVNGRSNRGQASCAVQFVFGVMLINILTIVQWLVTTFQIA
jgi:hypothetical protein